VSPIASGKPGADAPASAPASSLSIGNNSTERKKEAANLQRETNLREKELVRFERRLAYLGKMGKTLAMKVQFFIKQYGLESIVEMTRLSDPGRVLVRG